MKFFVVAAFMALAVAQVFATEAAVPVEQTAMEENFREKKAAYGGSAPSYGGATPSYGGSSYSAPPCPKNYLVSCAPHLQPVGCSQSYGGSSYGSAGAYTENRPQYMLPQYHAGRPLTFGPQRFY